MANKPIPPLCQHGSFCGSHRTCLGVSVGEVDGVRHCRNHSPEAIEARDIAEAKSMEDLKARRAALGHFLTDEQAWTMMQNRKRTPSIGMISAIATLVGGMPR